MMTQRMRLKSLLTVEIWLVGGAAVLGLLSARFLPFGTILGVGFLLTHLAFGTMAHRRTPSDLAVLVVAAAGLISLLVSARPDVSGSQAHRLWTGIALYYALVQWIDSEDRSRRIQWLFGIAGVALSVYAFFSVDWAQEKIPFIPQGFYSWYTLRAPDVVHPNVLAGSLVIFAILSGQAVMWNRPRDRFPIWLFSLIAFIFMSGVLVLSQSRGALIAWTAALLLLITLRFRFGWLMFILPPILAAWATAVLGTDRVVDLLLGGQLASGVQGRLDIWARGLYMVQDFPFTGVGIGLFPDIATEIYGYSWGSSNPVLHVHNLFLQVGLDLGIPGLIAWLAVFGSGFSAAWRSYRMGRRLNSRTLAGLGAGFLAAQVAVAVHGLLDAVLWGLVRTAPLLWVIWGCTTAVYLIAAEKDKRVSG